MAGEADPICSLTTTTMLTAGLTNVHIEIFEKASHFFLMEQPTRFERLLRDWLTAHA